MDPADNANAAAQNADIADTTPDTILNGVAPVAAPIDDQTPGVDDAKPAGVLADAEPARVLDPQPADGNDVASVDDDVEKVELPPPQPAELIDVDDNSVDNNASKDGDGNDNGDPSSPPAATAAPDDTSTNEHTNSDEAGATSDQGVDCRYPKRRKNERIPMNIRRTDMPTYVHQLQGTINVQSSEEVLTMTEEERDQYVLGVILMQYSLNKGLRNLGVQAQNATAKELKQHHDLSTITPLNPEKLNKKQKQGAVSSLMFLKEKRDSEIKGRMCANGRKQRTYEGYDKNDAASPTTATESVFITGVIDAREKRKAAIMDLPCTFLHALNDEEVIMVLEGPLAEMMCMVDPKLYHQYITTNSKGKQLLYVKCYKAVYGLLRSALLFYKKLVVDLKAYGFEINPYDPCVATMDVNDSQMTVVWHVDNLKVSHCDDFELTRFASYLKDFYGKVKVSRGGKHDFLGMDLDFESVPGAMQVSMIPYLNVMFHEFPKELKGSAATPATKHLFKVRDPFKAKPLPEEKALAFHRTTAQLLFVSQ